MNFLRSAISSIKKNLSGEVSAGEAIGNTLKSVLTKKVVLTIAFPVVVFAIMLFVVICALSQLGIKVELMQMVDTSSYSESGYGTDGGSNGVILGGNSLAEAMVNLAVAQMDDYSAVNGYKYWSYYGNFSRVPWCAYFVSWIVLNTEYNGQKLNSIITTQSGSCGDFMSEAKSKGTYIKNDGSYQPQTGDLIWFIWHPGSGYICEHIGIVQGYDKSTNQIITIEGNSSNSVKENKYSLNSSNVIGFSHWY